MKSVDEILRGAGGGAEPARDFVGEVLTILGFVVVQTRHGERMQLKVTGADGTEHLIWAGGVMADQVRELSESGHLPLALQLVSRTSGSTGNSYFLFEQPGPPSDEEVPPEEFDEGDGERP